MYIIKVFTFTRHEFFGAWIDEIHKKICHISGKDDPTYMVFCGDPRSTAYVYTGDCNRLPCDGCLVVNPVQLLDIEATPVHCSPEVDMCFTSLAQFNGDTSEHSEYAMEDVTLSLIAKSMLKLDVQIATSDDDIKSMQLFVSMALPNSDTSTLMSFINHLMIVRGYDSVMYPELPALKHTMLEVKSEMMKCNQNMYCGYKHKVLDNMLESIVSNSRSKNEVEYRVSEIVYEILSDSVVSSMGTMWCFNEGVWQECAHDGFVWNFLTKDFIQYLQSKGADDLALHMMSNHVRSRVMKDVKLRLQDDKFYEMLDSKRVVRMTNGVYDTNTRMLTNPVPSDYVSVVSGVPYQVFDTASYEVAMLINILSTIFPDPDVLEFFLLSCGTFLEGYNSPKAFYVWWGSGNNAKTLVQTLVMKAFGDYCSTAPTSLVTGQRSSSSNATPELCHIEKKLVVFLQEPNPEETIRAGKMKEMTGNDSMYMRQLFKSGRTVTLKAKIVLVCNNIVEIPGMDAAVRRRLVVIPFVSTFVDMAEYKIRSEKDTLEPNSYIIDPSVERNLLSCKVAFMYVLCKKYSEFRNAGMALHIPQKIREVTEIYATKNNHQLTFIRSYVHYVEGAAIAAAEIYETFKEWFGKSYPGKKVKDFDRFTAELCNEGYKDDGKGIIDNAFVSYVGDN